MLGIGQSASRGLCGVLGTLHLVPHRALQGTVGVKGRLRVKMREGYRGEGIRSSLADEREG